jgi:hypothetical protein
MSFGLAGGTITSDRAASSSYGGQCKSNLVSTRTPPSWSPIAVSMTSAKMEEKAVKGKIIEGRKAGT